MAGLEIPAGTMSPQSRFYMPRASDAIALDPHLAAPWTGKGNVLAELQQYELALAAYDQAIALDPNFAYPWNQ